MRIASSLALALALAALTACSSPAPKEGGPLGDGPLYAVMFEVYDDTGSNSYLAVLDSLDVEAVDPATSIEFAGGRAYLQSYGGRLYVGEPAAPVVHRYAIGEDGALVEEGSVSFANFGLDAGVIDPWALTFVSDEKAYLFDFREGTHIVFDPTTMEIVGEIPAAPEFLREGWSLDGSPPMVRGDRLYRTVYWADWDTATYSTDQLLAVYDVQTDELVELVTETRCPATGNLTHQDEAGNIYFSNWIWPVAGTLLRDAPPSCVLRIPPGSDTFDPDWTLSYEALSGHEGAMFTYTGEGKGLVAIFDETQVPIEDDTDPWAFAGSPIWQIWDVDLEAVTGAPIEGIPPNAGAYTPVTFGDRRFLLVPGDGWASTDVYELTEDGAVPGLDIPGWSYAFVQVR